MLLPLRTLPLPRSPKSQPSHHGGLGATPLHTIKLNFDGYVKQSSAVACVVLRNHTIELLHAYSYNSGKAAMFIVEASVSQGFHKIIIQRDNLLVFNALNGTWSSPWQIDHIQILGRFFSNLAHGKLVRALERQTKADWIANVAHLVENSFPVVPCINSSLHSILVTDALEVPLARRIS